QRGEIAELNDLKKAFATTGESSESILKTAIAAAAAGATLGEMASAAGGAKGEKQSVSPLNLYRVTAEYEELRKKSVEFKSRTGERPTVFLANMGPPGQHKARADFTAGFFEPGGFSVVSSPGFDDAGTAAAAAIASAAPITVICSTDDTYPDLVPEFTETVKKKKPDIIVVVAGYPQDQINHFQSIGVDEFIHLRANNLQILKKLQEKAGA
ncbi:MAG: methylmalonyl-CoA mutase, partial [Proteobacteria bacterium]|nr:methylmalonyl-CoA mutase [Pseudomonadota bacterium]